MRWRGLGALLTTEVEHADLGTHRGRRLRGRVERRSLRLGLGGAREWRVELGRSRPSAVEVVEPATGSTGERRYEVAIPAPADPWPRAARRMLLCWAGLTLAVALIRRRLRRRAALAREASQPEW